MKVPTHHEDMKVPKEVDQGDPYQVDKRVIWLMIQFTYYKYDYDIQHLFTYDSIIF